MRNPEVLAKGEYLRPQSFAPVTLKRYLFIAEGDKTYILLEFRNNRDEALSELSFTLKQFDSQGNVLAQSEHSERIRVGAGKTFVFKKIEADSACADFSAENLSARFGAYIYSMRGGELAVGYEAAPSAPPAASAEQAVQDRIEGYTVTVKKPRYSRAIGIFACITLLCIAALLIVQVLVVRNTFSMFMKDGVVYGFENGIDEEGSNVYVSGYRGKGDAVIPAEVAGHPVIRVEGGAFQGNTRLKSIRFEGSIRINAYAFADCSSLQSVDFENVTSIGEHAFYNCDDLQEVRSSTLTEIDSYAFVNCYGLETVEIQGEDRRITLGGNIFANCYSLRTVAIYPLIEYNGYKIFRSCSNMEELYLHNYEYTEEGEPLGTSEANELDFLSDYGLDRLHTLHIGYMDCIPDYFCSDYTLLNEVTIDNLVNPVVGEGAFRGCGNLRTVNIPAVTEVKAYAFENSWLRTFDGSKLVRIGEDAFARSLLTDISFEGNTVLKEISGYAFRDSSRLKSLVLPESVETVGAYAFGDCRSLQEIVLPDGLKYIAEYAFEGCSSLHELKIPDGIETIGPGILSGCTGLTSLTMPSLRMSANSPVALQVFFNESVENLRSVTLTQETELPEGAFAYFSGLQSVSLPDTLSKIGANAFEGCHSLSSFVVPASVREIGTGAFIGCSSLASVTLPASLERIEEAAFEQCYRLYEIKNNSSLPISVGSESYGQIGKYALKIYGSGETMPDRTENGWSYLKTDGVRYLVRYPRGSSINLPGEPEQSYRVAPYLFCDDDFIEEVNSTGSAEAIGEYAFWQCDNLIRATLSEGITEIGEGAFSECGLLAQMTLPSSLAGIGEDAFSACDCLYEVWNLSSLPIAAGGAGYGGVGKNARYIHTSAGEESRIVYDRGGYYFERDGESWTLFASSPFVSNTLPSEVEADGVTIESYVLGRGFCNDSFGAIFIPLAVSRIESGAFDGCIGLSAIYFEGTEEQWKAIGGYAPADCKVVCEW